VNAKLKYASSELRDPVQAVAEFANKIGHEDIETILFFALRIMILKY
jgi:hypothetical protein